MQTKWEGYYLDGKSSTRHRAVISLEGSGLNISTDNHLTLWWPYAETRQTQGFYSGEQIRLEKGEGNREAILIADPAFLTALHHVAPASTPHFYNPAHRLRRRDRTMLAAFAIVGIAVGLYVWGIPGLSTLLAARVPVAWEERLGHAMAERVAPNGKRCTGQALKQAINSILHTLTGALVDVPYTFQVIVVNDHIMNAFAAPGGYILVFRGLLERTRNPEELAGVLAHEIQHIVHKHATRALLQNASTKLLLAALTGEMSGAFGLEGANTLGALRYSRQHEEEADAEGMKLLIAANVNPSGMVNFLDGLRSEGLSTSGFMTYLSTHPSTDDRIQKLQWVKWPANFKPVKLLQDFDWSDVKETCRH